MSRILLALLAFLALSGQRDPILVPEVSQHEIRVRQGFTGTELLLYGAILDPEGRRARQPYDIVVVLKAPKLDGDRLVFDVVPIEGDLGQEDGPATLFIDIVNLPIARRTGHRAAWYAGAKQP